MKRCIQLDKRAAIVGGAIAVIAFAVLLTESGVGEAADTNSAPAPAPANPAFFDATVTLSPSQLNAIKIAAVGSYPFSVERTAVGNIDYNEDLSVQVFSPYQGKIITPSAHLGDEVKKGQPLYTIDSPDLLQAESTLVSAAASFNLTSKELARAKELSGTNGVSEREMEQAASDAQTAAGSLKAARDTLGIFGKTEAEIDQILAHGKIDSTLIVRSPINGRVTARNAQPGLLVQPGNAPAPYAVADLSTKWMVVNATESDSPLFHLGQTLQAAVMAYPDRIFNGRISEEGAVIDPNTHRVMLRCQIADPKDELRPGMLASFIIRVAEPVQSIAIPMNGVVRNGDGTMAAWVTSDRHVFTQRIIKIGLQQDGQYQVLEGLRSGELAVTDGAIFLSNILYAPPPDD